MKTTDPEQLKQRYKNRLASMHRMAQAGNLDGNKEGEGSAAQQALDRELAKYAQYGYPSPEAALADAYKQPDTYTMVDMVETVVAFPADASDWQVLLFHACCYQVRAMPRRGKGLIRIFGAPQQAELAQWLYAQLLADIQAGANAAWESLGPDQAANNYFSFVKGYCVHAAGVFHNNEQKRYRVDAAEGVVPEALPPAQAPEIQCIHTPGDSLEIMAIRRTLARTTAEYAQSVRPGKTVRVGGALLNDEGVAAADRDKGKIGNRRMGGGGRALPGS